jgi:hypothetical protein
MTKDRIGRICEGLTSREKATLVFGHLAQNDLAEADRVEGTVPVGTYRMPDPGFWDRLNRLMALAYFWGLAHWKQLALHGRLRAALLILAPFPSMREKVADGMEVLRRIDGHLIALDEILQVVCDANGLDAVAVRKLADVDGPYQSTSFADPIPDPEFGSDMREVLSLMAK